MRIDVLLFALLSSAASLAASRSLAVFGNDQVRLDASYPVPGKNPLTVRDFHHSGKRKRKKGDHGQGRQLWGGGGKEKHDGHGHGPFS